MAETPGIKTKYVQVVMAKWNYDEHGDLCQQCYNNLIEYCDEKDLAEIPDYNLKQFYIPVEWYHACFKLGCPHGNKPLVKSAYIEEKHGKDC